MILKGILYSQSNNSIEIIDNQFFNLISKESGSLAYLQENN